MRSYREHLRVPASYWALGFITMATFASFAWAGFSYLVAVAAYLVLMVAPGVALWIWGNATIMVTDTELRAGREALPLARSGHVQVLDKAQTAKLRGPLADPASLMLIRPYLSRAVYIEVAEPAAGESRARPYWLVGSRDPEALAAAVVTARAQAARTGDPSVA
ncbi:MAG: DUF3093 domain-containing protein [Actinomycetota bacterium]|nr:DUF3093 domain-containing protein [Actinomycetota bacterium]